MRNEAIFEIETYQTTTGHTLTGVKLNDVTYGTLNEAKDNVIVFPHFLGWCTCPVGGVNLRRTTH